VKPAANSQLAILADRAALAVAAAEVFVQAAADAIAARGCFTVALSGGSTPRDLYALLASEPWRARLDWEQVLVFWGDERCVPPDHPQSNYRLAREMLLDRVPIQQDRVYRMLGEAADRQAAADQYAATITRLVPAGPAGRPSFDLMLQGLGADGHTASLLPGSALVHERQRLAAVSDREREGTIRLTVTPPVLQHAARLLFLVAGEDKADALHQVLYGAARPERYPAQVVRAAQGQLIWLVDRSAAARLPEQ
jgi:6-phosphogluconolactonase